MRGHLMVEECWWHSVEVTTYLCEHNKQSVGKHSFGLIVSLYDGFCFSMRNY